jgi:hypothetical protein
MCSRLAYLLLHARRFSLLTSLLEHQTDGTVAKYMTGATPGNHCQQPLSPEAHGWAQPSFAYARLSMHVAVTADFR